MKEKGGKAMEINNLGLPSEALSCGDVGGETPSRLATCACYICVIILAPVVEARSSGPQTIHLVQWHASRSSL